MDVKTCEKYRESVTKKIETNYKELADRVSKLDNSLTANTEVLRGHSENFHDFTTSLKEVLEKLDTKANNGTLRLVATTTLCCMITMLGIFYKYTLDTSDLFMETSHKISNQGAEFRERDHSMELRLTKIEAEGGVIAGLETFFKSYDINIED